MNGDIATVKLPVEIWQRGSTWTFSYTSQKPVEKIVLDPDGVLPAVDRKNNEWNDGK